MKWVHAIFCHQFICDIGSFIVGSSQRRPWGKHSEDTTLLGSTIQKKPEQGKGEQGRECQRENKTRCYQGGYHEVCIVRNHFSEKRCVLLCLSTTQPWSGRISICLLASCSHWSKLCFNVSSMLDMWGWYAWPMDLHVLRSQGKKLRGKHGTLAVDIR